ncbi:hypothetical protein N9D08_00765 [bacterium]|nr:hypothetical protein [bacterium]
MPRWRVTRPAVLDADDARRRRDERATGANDATRLRATRRRRASGDATTRRGARRSNRFESISSSIRSSDGLASRATTRSAFERVETQRRARARVMTT